MRIAHLFLASALAAGAATAGPRIYAPSSLYTTNPNQDDLIVFDADDPEGYTVIGAMGVNNITFGGMDFTPDGTLYAYASLFRSTGGAASGLYRVDRDTGIATPVGNSPQSLDDIAYNPVDGRMYGFRSQNGTPRLYTIDLNTGVVSAVGVIAGLPSPARVIGLAIDSDGDFYYHDVSTDQIFKGSALSVAALYDIPQDTSFSQGMTIDWSRDDTGYHAAVGLGEFPNYFVSLNTFGADGSGYQVGPGFGDNIDGGDGFFYPPVEPGDLAIEPGAPGCSDADLAEPFGTLNIFDVQAYIGLYNTMDAGADLAEPFGVFNIFDLQAYIGVYNAGCP